LRSYKNGDFSDLTITCGGLTFKVHIVVVCSSCDFFKRSIRFAVGKEAEEKRIDLPEDDPEMIRRLITYLYVGDYDPNNGQNFSQLLTISQHESSTSTPATHHSRYRKETRSSGIAAWQDNCACLTPYAKSNLQPVTVLSGTKAPSDYKVVAKPENASEVNEPLTIHATMYALGDKYQVEGLCDLAKEKFRSCLHHHAHSEDFISAVQTIHSTTPESNRGLRDVVVSAFRSQFNVDIKQIPGAEEKMDSIDELSFALIKSWPVKTEPAKLAAPAQKTPSAFEGWGSQASNTSSAFGAAPFTTSLFGSSTVDAATSNSSGGLFGGAGRPATTIGSSTLFGGGSQPAAATGSPTLFGGQQSTSNTSLFAISRP
ncbi:hypothetical protein EK21DRAFT_80003, partial [Setomelanomma holmii]